MDGVDEVFGAVETCVVQCLALEDAEPDLNLIEPTRARWCEVEGDVRMRSEPVLVALVCVQVVQDHVDLAVSRLILNHFIHEGLEVGSLLGLRGLAANDAGGDLQGVPWRL